MSSGGWGIWLSKESDEFNVSLDYLASSVLTVCEDAKWASFVFYVNNFVMGDIDGRDPVRKLKNDIEVGLSEESDKRKRFFRAHAPLWAVLEELREKHPDFIQKYCKLKNFRYANGLLPEKLSLEQMAGLLGEVTGGEDVQRLFKKYRIGQKSGKWRIAL